MPPWLRDWRPTWLVLILAALPVLLMARKVEAATRMNYQDYWDAMLRISTPSGGLKFRGLFTYQNEHPFFVPQVIYYIDARLGNGTNHELGLFAVLMAAVTLLLIWQLLPKAWSPFARSGVLLIASAFTLCPSGAWNFLKGMSGTAWLTANVFALLAILLARRGRALPATILAAISIMTYGTGFAAPVAVIVVLVLLGHGWRRWAPPLALLLVALVIYKATSNGTAGGVGIGHDPGLLIKTFLTNLSTLWDPTGSSLGLIAGACGLAITVLCFAQYWMRRDEMTDLIPWWGVSAYSLGASVLISVGRSQLFLGDGAQARYVSLSALFWVSVVVIALRTAPSPSQLGVRVVATGVAVLVFWGASPALLATAVAQSPRQNVLAAAVWFNAADPFASIMAQPSQQIRRLQAMHDYPFDSSYRVGCGLKPTDSIDMSTVKPIPTALFDSQNASLDTDAVIGNARQVTGWIYRAGQPTQCALFVDSGGKIVGGGSGATPRGDVQESKPALPANTGFQIVTPASQTSAVIVLGFGDGFFSVPTSLLRTTGTGSK